MIDKQGKVELVKKFGKNEKDTGSIEFQVALLTTQIHDLTEHLKANQKDGPAKRGLAIKVSKRKSLLTYLEGKNRDAYVKLVTELGLRK